MKRRIIVLATAFTVLLISLGMRTWYIQIAGNRELSEAAHLQQTLKINGVDNRTVIYDRNGARLTDTSKGYAYIIMRKDVDMKCRKLLEDMGAKEGDKSSDMYSIYHVENPDEKKSKTLERKYNAYVLKANKRYSKNQIAAHLIGYVNGDTGVYGIEEKYQNELYDEDNCAYVFTDGKGKILKGKKAFSSYGEDVFMTTIDMQVQKQTEKALSEVPYNCAAVVVERKTGNILAMASTPSYDPNSIEKYVKEGSSCLLNRCLQGYPPGSVFKIVVAAVALESGMNSSKEFICEGQETIDGVTIKCQKCHGKITMKEAFAYSCNCAFIQIGKEVGHNKLYEMAEEMGLGKQVLGLKEEAEGNIMKEEEALCAGIGNMSIGQGTMMATPLQIAKMTNIVANDGVDKGVYIIKETGKRKRIISEGTAKEIKNMAAGVMTYGTGDISITPSCAGKTGTAEAGEMIHGWFSGFFPVENPRYTITVFCENGKSGRTSALPIFDQIAENLR